MPEFNLAALRSWILDPSSRLDVAILISFILHTVIVFGITFKLPSTKFNNKATPLEVVLVNSKSKSEPHEANSLAQANLDGGGNTEDNRRAKTPFPLPPKHKQSIDVSKAKQKTKQLEQEAKRLMTAVNSKEKNSSIQFSYGETKERR